MAPAGGPGPSSKRERTQSPGVVSSSTANRVKPPAAEPHRRRRKFILCFDGTGNKFSGTDSDSNILKIYRMLDRADGAQFHYYQPGIGTYVNTTSLSHTSTAAKVRSWWEKTKDQAIGTSFGDHVLAGYRFLMRYYISGDDIYLFGFSRGAYTARFLAEMLDHVGLLSAGNEEMIHFAWTTFQKWQIRQERTAKEKARKKYLLDFMCAFRETFARPVRRIRFLGLFDTVNSVPAFENAIMQRSKFPYTAHSTARVIRHAVSIDERRAKFRQDLISEIRHSKEERYKAPHLHLDLLQEEEEIQEDAEEVKSAKKASRDQAVTKQHLRALESYRDRSETSGLHSLNPQIFGRSNDAASVLSDMSRDSLAAIQHHDYYDDDESDGESQDIQEVWFAGQHGDIGGGWDVQPGEEAPLSHIPLVWMVREAQRAGLQFDPMKLRALNCCLDNETSYERRQTAADVPQIQVSSLASESDQPRNVKADKAGAEASLTEPIDILSPFRRALDFAATKAKVHDSLSFKDGQSFATTLVWNLMEYLPFRRMDLQPDGSWKSITWPLPCGEVRDIPEDAVIHGSVIRRMGYDPNYRPGNLICGGGGRGVRKAPPELGMGSWKVLREEGDPVGECWVRAPENTSQPTNEKDTGAAKA